MKGPQRPGAPQRYVSKHERKKFNRDQRDQMDELVPKATGREAQIEKRKMASSKMHAASRGRDDGTIPDRFLKVSSVFKSRQ